MEHSPLSLCDLFYPIFPNKTDGDEEVSDILSEIVGTIEFEMSPLYSKPIISTDVKYPDCIEEKTSSVIEDQPTCCICMDTLDGSRNITLKCDHIFHTDCFLENMAQAPSNKHKCPLCREEICSEVSVKRVAELEDEIVALENTLDDKDTRLGYVTDAMIYFHDADEAS